MRLLLFAGLPAALFIGFMAAMMGTAFFPALLAPAEPLVCDGSLEAMREAFTLPGQTGETVQMVCTGADGGARDVTFALGAAAFGIWCAGSFALLALLFLLLRRR